MQEHYIDRRVSENTDFLIEVMVIFCIMCRLGFPGNLASVMGGNIVLLGIDYGSSLLQVIIMLLSNGNTVGDIQLIDLKKKYSVIYWMLAIMFAISMVVNSNRIKQTTIIVRFSITAFFGLWLAEQFDPERLLKIILYAQIGILIANLLTFTVFMNAGYHIDDGYGYTFRGIYTQKNGLGSVFAYGIALQGALFHIKKLEKKSVSVYFWVVFAAQMFFLFVSKATTAIFTGLVPLIYLYVYDHAGVEKRRFQWGTIYAIVSIGFLFIGLSIMPLFSPVLEALGKDATLSNRIPMWEEIVAFMLESHTLTGYGLLQFWESPGPLKALQGRFPRNSWYRSMAYGAHSTLLEMWLDVGLIGVAVYLLTIIYCFRNVNELSKKQYIICSVLIIPNLISGLTDRHYTNANYSTLFFFVMLGIACNREKKAKLSVDKIQI